MRIDLYVTMLVIFLAFAQNAFSQTDQDRKMQIIAESVIKDILIKIKKSDERHVLLNDINPAAITFSSNKSFPGAKGWIVRWRIERDTAMVPNPNMPAKSTSIIIVTIRMAYY